MSSGRSRSQSSASSHSCTSGSEDDHSSSRPKSAPNGENLSQIIMWVFEAVPEKKRENGMSSQQVINFIKKYYDHTGGPKSIGHKIGAALRDAVSFGLIKKKGNYYFLTGKNY